GSAFVDVRASAHAVESLREAVSRAQAVCDEFTSDPAPRVTLFEAQIELAEVLKGPANDPRGTIQTFLAAIATAEMISNGAPDDVTARRNLSVAHGKLG